VTRFKVPQFDPQIVLNTIQKLQEFVKPYPSACAEQRRHLSLLPKRDRKAIASAQESISLGLILKEPRRQD